MDGPVTPSDVVQFADPVRMWINDILVWTGFGTIVGLLAKAIMPGRDPGGALATLCMGIGGTVIGCGVWMMLMNGQRVTPVSPLGMLVSTSGAFALLFFYRLLGGYWFVEGEQPVRRYRTRRTTRRRATAPAYDYEE